MTGLAVDTLSVRLGGEPIVTDLSFALPPGSVTGVVGPNGAGKSTLLRALAGTVPSVSGDVMWNGTDLLGMGRRHRARVLAFVEQDSHTGEPLSAEEVVELGRTPHQPVFQFGEDPGATARITREAMMVTGCADLANQQYTTLSGGQRQRVNLARALAQEPQLLLLDEPTNHLDPKAQLSTLKLVRKLARGGITVMAALHDLSHAAAWCDQVLVLADRGLHAAGEPERVLTPSLIKQVYGVEAAVLQHPETLQPVFALSLPTEADTASGTGPGLATTRRTSRG